MYRLFKVPAIYFVVIICIAANSSAFCPISFFPGDVTCGAPGEFKWIGSFNQGVAVDPNSQIAVKISGGCPPYSWSVSGNGYWLENDFTYGEDNIVYTDNNIGCLAAITVLDKYGNQLTGYLRAPGVWILKSEGVCELSGLPTSSLRSNRHEDYIIVGNKKQVQRTGITWKMGGCCYVNRPTINCPGECYSKCYDGCDECIAYDRWLGEDKSKYDELNYSWPCFGSIELIKEGRNKGKWQRGMACTKVSFLKYYEWECND